MKSSPRPRPTSAPPLEDDDLLDEILLRLSPDPSSLPRASAVCTRWRRLVSDPGFVNRFQLHHRRSPPILGCFVTDQQRATVSFVPTLEAPNRVPAERFSLQLGDRGRFSILNCRHGLLLMFLPLWSKVLVWDPVTGDQHRLDIPPGLDTKQGIGGAVLRAGGAIRHFQVVLVGRDKQNILACVYSSEAGVWSNPISTPPANELPVDFRFLGVPAVLVGDSLHWFINCGLHKILEFDLHRQILTVIPGPLDEFPVGISQILVMRAEDGGLGVLFKSGCNVQLWKRKIDCDGEASWVLGRTFELDTLLSLNSEKRYAVIRGLAEYNNAVVVQTVAGHFMVQLESLQFKMFKTSILHFHQPFEKVYTGGEASCELPIKLYPLNKLSLFHLFTRWRRLVSDPGFVGRFLLHHRLRPPILGCFITDQRRATVSFVPTLEAPNRVPAERFSLELGDRGSFMLLSCRHGLLLMFLPLWSKLLVWDPVTGDQHRLDIPLGFDTKKEIGGAVLRAAGDTRHFQVVLVGRDKQNILACVYSSEAGIWSKLISAPLPNPFLFEFMGVPAVLVGDSLHWFINCGLHKILEFDLHRQILTVIPGPLDEFPVGISQILVMRAEDGGLGVLFKSGCNVQLWKRKIDCDGEASWVLGRTFELDTLLSLNSEKRYAVIRGLAEYNNAVVVQTVAGHFMVQLESLQFKMFKTSILHFHQPFEKVYTGETSIGGGHNGAELLHNT